MTTQDEIREALAELVTEWNLLEYHIPISEWLAPRLERFGRAIWQRAYSDIGLSGSIGFQPEGVCIKAGIAALKGADHEAD